VLRPAGEDEFEDGDEFDELDDADQSAREASDESTTP
jgi:hypothetical protein